MKVGDLVRCIWQPGVSHIENDCAVSMQHHIKGELGIVIGIRPIGERSPMYTTAFPQHHHTHELSYRAFEVLR